MKVEVGQLKLGAKFKREGDTPHWKVWWKADKECRCTCNNGAVADLSIWEKVLWIPLK